MSFLVVDSTVIVPWFFREPLTELALYLRSDWQAGIVELIAPDFLAIEVCHYLDRQRCAGRISPEESEAALEDFLHLAIPAVPSHSLLIQAYRMSALFQQSLDKTLYLALAEDIGGRAITADLALYQSVHCALSFVGYLGEYRTSKI